MFETLVAATSPRRSHLAGPAAALAHGIALAGFVGAAWWNPGEPSLPDRQALDMVFRVAVDRPGGGGGGHPGGPRSTASTIYRTRERAFPDRVTNQTPAVASGDPEIGGDTPGVGQHDEPGIGVQDGPGSCPTCPEGPGGGDDTPLPPGGNVLSPILIDRLEPAYPEAMRRGHQEGLVVLEAIIGRDGSIEETRVVTATNALFEDAALRAVRQWRYRPGRLNDQPVRVILQVTVRFRLR